MSAHMTFSQKKAARNENCMTKPKNKKIVSILLNIVFIKITTIIILRHYSSIIS